MVNKILNTYNEDGTINHEELAKAMDDVTSEIAEQIPSTRSEKLKAWRYFSMLANPKTHIRNFVSNAVMSSTRQVKNVVGRILEGTGKTKAIDHLWA